MRVLDVITVVAIGVGVGLLLIIICLVTVLVCKCYKIRHRWTILQIILAHFNFM